MDISDPIQADDKIFLLRLPIYRVYNLPGPSVCLSCYGNVNIEKHDRIRDFPPTYGCCQPCFFKKLYRGGGFFTPFPPKINKTQLY